jgi:hypothetical protein
MKKLIIILVVLAALIFGGIAYGTSRINEEVTSDDLPETVYASDDTTEQGINNSAIALFIPTNSEEDTNTWTKTFLNYVIYESIKNTLNEDYDPLGDCDTSACNTIVETKYVDVKYAYAHLNDDNQIILTVSANRGSYPSFDTAVHLTFDVAVEPLEGSLVLTLDKTHLADDEISEAMLDRILNRIDTASIEDSVTTGTLDLDEKTYTYTYDFTSIFQN